MRSYTRSLQKQNRRIWESQATPGEMLESGNDNADWAWRFQNSDSKPKHWNRAHRDLKKRIINILAGESTTNSNQYRGHKRHDIYFRRHYLRMIQNWQHVTTPVFGVSAKQETKTITDTAFIDSKILITEPKDRQIIQNSGHALVILKSIEDESAVQLVNCSAVHDQELFKLNLLTCKVAIKMTIPPRSEYTVIAPTIDEDTTMIKAVSGAINGNRPQVTRGIVKTLSKPLLYIMFVSILKMLVTFSKNMKVALLPEAWSIIASSCPYKRLDQSALSTCCLSTKESETRDIRLLERAESNKR